MSTTAAALDAGGPCAGPPNPQPERPSAVEAAVMIISGWRLIDAVLRTPLLVSAMVRLHR
jgi:hypothetical protein